MSYDLAHRLVVGIASSALFDLSESDAVFRGQGEEAYRIYQEAHIDDPLAPGVAYPFIRRLLSLNSLADNNNPLVEVIVLSRNAPDTGLRIMRSIATYQLGITRAIFMQGRSPYEFMPALNMSLFLSANEEDVREAVRRGLPAGRVLASKFIDDHEDLDLRIAFDFDGVLAADSAEVISQTEGVEAFRRHESANIVTPLDPGPLKDFLLAINKIQVIEELAKKENPNHHTRVRVALITARNAPAHERAVRSLKTWGVTVNDAFFLGGVNKGAITKVLRPHIFFDDQPVHLHETAPSTPSVHIPFGVVNLLAR